MGGLAAGMHRPAMLVTALVALILAALLAIGASPASPAGDWTFVQVQRVNSLTLQFGTDTFATQNAFGGAFASAGQSSMESALASGVADGSISWLLEMPGLTDLSGTSNPSFDVGVLDATPVQPAGNPATYDGTSDLDWWYVPYDTELQPDGSATHKLTATLAAKVLNAGPGSVTLGANLGGHQAVLAMSSTSIQANIGASSAPLKSTNGFPPGHEAGENLPDSLTSFESMSSGKLRGRISARSLYNTQIPAALAAGSAQPCAENYSVDSTLLDLLVSGCKVFFVTVVTATQPDTFDPAVGSGAYAFTVDGSKHVNGCTHDGVAASLDACLDAAAYSSYFHFTTDRVIDRLQVSVGKLLTVQSAGSGSGTVASSPAGIDCGTDCTEWYASGRQVTLTANPSAGSRFDGWTGCDNPSGSTCVMTMDADKPVTATFGLESSSTGDGSAGTGGAGAGGGATPGSGNGTTPPPDTTPPAFGSATVSPRKVRKRATVKFTLSEAAQVTFAFESVAPGRRVGAKCVKPTRANARTRRCNRFVPVVRLTAPAVAGANQKAFATRIGKRTLKPGAYRLTLRATDAAGNASQPKRLTFVVVKPR